ncbi:hypothetical protein A2335_00120 [Candidatus Peregrinibacteria bacterium RIFOXYB2_FULL_32_7]|nr:MAG: hypothetical protein A2335_00120 [Candidatus Peregrinibacteria bacterium RIFOXYB2_FULL_32_7]
MTTDIQVAQPSRKALDLLSLAALEGDDQERFAESAELAVCIKEFWDEERVRREDLTKDLNREEGSYQAQLKALRGKNYDDKEGGQNVFSKLPKIAENDCFPRTLTYLANKVEDVNTSDPHVSNILRNLVDAQRFQYFGWRIFDSFMNDVDPGNDKIYTDEENEGMRVMLRILQVWAEKLQAMFLSASKPFIINMDEACLCCNNFKGRDVVKADGSYITLEEFAWQRGDRLVIDHVNITPHFNAKTYFETVLFQFTNSIIEELRRKKFLKKNGHEFTVESEEIQVLLYESMADVMGERLFFEKDDRELHTVKDFVSFFARHAEMRIARIGYDKKVQELEEKERVDSATAKEGFERDYTGMAVEEFEFLATDHIDGLRSGAQTLGRVDLTEVPNVKDQLRIQIINSIATLDPEKARERIKILCDSLEISLSDKEIEGYIFIATARKDTRTLIGSLNRLWAKTLIAF